MSSEESGGSDLHSFAGIDTDIITGAYVDEDGRIWLNIDAAEQSSDCISCDYCSIETAKGMLCIDTKETMCMKCFKDNYPGAL